MKAKKGTLPHYEWEHGEQLRFANAAGMSPANLNDILHRRAGRALPGPGVARRLMAASERWHGLKPSFPVTTLEMWLFPDEHHNPLLFY
jgi:hypothetical protein